MFKLKGRENGRNEGRKTMKAVQSHLFLLLFFLKCSYSKINLNHSFKFKNPRPRK